MNIHIVVEGNVGEKSIYRCWVPLVNPLLSYVDHISELGKNNFTIVSGRGYPQYFSIIDDAISDVNHYRNVDRLVVAADSEEMEYDEKCVEIEDHISNAFCAAEIRIVIQHFCLETWALGNRVAIRPNPQLEELRTYKRFYDVRAKNPEGLPSYPPEDLNRAQFAEKYLRRALNDKYRNVTYSKRNPKVLMHTKYFTRVKERYEETGHIASFDSFLQAFV